MSLLVKDSMSGKLVEVGESGGLGLYICGPTVYDHIHVGNARAPLFWDVVARYLRSRGYEVTFVQNITDIEDKIINKANQEGVSWQEIVDRYTDSFHERLQMLGIGLPDIEPRATEHIPEMISLIEELIEKGHAYAPSEANGDVYYSVESFPPYGALSHQRPEAMRETEKGQTGFKRSPLDFALWKASKPGEPSWESPWGSGRPGWHIECSAMVSKHLPDGADIHGGGTDIRFPHHENELAQSTAAHPDQPFARAWAHHGMVRLEGPNKMAKSVGNVLDVERAVNLHRRNAIRMWLLQSHYSQPIDYSAEILKEKDRAYWRLQNLYAKIIDSTSSSNLAKNLTGQLKKRFDAAMLDDFNTPEALSALFDATRQAEREISTHPAARSEFFDLKEAFDELAGEILGFELSGNQRLDSDAPIHQGQVGGGTTRHIPPPHHQEVVDELAGTKIYEELEKEIKEEGSINLISITVTKAAGSKEIDERTKVRAGIRDRARRMKDWEAADRLRDKINADGVSIEDALEGPILSRR
jgi:cysteinyl-tRNA synthetase